MININELDTYASYKRSIGVSEFDLKSSLGAMSLLEEYDTLEVYYSASDGNEVDGMPQALAGYAEHG